MSEGAARVRAKYRVRGRTPGLAFCVMRPGSCRASAQVSAGRKSVFRRAVSPAGLQDKASFVHRTGLGEGGQRPGLACSLVCFCCEGGCVSWLDGHPLAPNLHSLFVP